MVPRILYIINYVARVIYYIIASFMIYKYLHIPLYLIQCPSFCWQERPERQRREREPPPTAVKKQYPRSGKLGFDQKIVFAPVDTLT